MTELRPYQRELLQDAQRALAAPKARVMLQLPTGGGKTRIAAALLAGWIRGGGKAAWLTHRRELSAQTRDVLNNNSVWAANTLDWGVDDPVPSATDGVVIEMVQTVSKRNKYRSVWDEFGPKDLLVIDEAHHAPARGWERTIRQWPGPAIGLTATPWRIEKNLGFDHLFDCLILGPEISKLQAERALAKAYVWVPDSDRTIVGGRLNSNGEYIGSEIELANQGRPNVMTWGALEFWRTHARDRQTIIYAVSKGHAENLTAVFEDAGVPAAVILGDTPKDIRDSRIRQFSDGKLKVLVNVAVATEGFDLPEVSCVVLARPTTSLALYLQMVGRGLRPKKKDGSNCLILDLARNVERLGFPDDDHHSHWSLKPRRQRGEGTAPSPVVRCGDCEGVSPASNHNCQFCENPFGKDCQWCGQWRAWKWWSAETYCGGDHDLVCNLCHPDAHKVARLPLIGELREMLDEELTERLHTLTEVQAQIRDVGKELAHTYKKTKFNDLTDQLRGLLKKETRVKREIYAEMERKIGANILSRLLDHLKISVEEIAEDDLVEKDGVRMLIRRSTGEIVEWAVQPS